MLKRNTYKLENMWTINGKLVEIKKSWDMSEFYLEAYRTWKNRKN